MKLIYGTSYFHTPTGLIERGGVKTLKDIKAGERFSKALDLSLDVMRKTPHTLKKARLRTTLRQKTEHGNK